MKNQPSGWGQIILRGQAPPSPPTGAGGGEIGRILGARPTTKLPVYF